MDTVALTHLLLNVIAVTMLIVGLAGAVVPMLPGIPLIFGGLWIGEYGTLINWIPDPPGYWRSADDPGKSLPDLVFYR